MSRPAFTLLEIVAVLTILAIAVSLVVVHYREPLTRIRLEHAFETVERLDHRVRHWCKTNNTPAQIKADLDRSVFIAVNENGSPLPIPIPEARISGGMKLKELRMMGRNRFGRDTFIPYTSRGTAPCWSFSIAYSGNREQYRLMIGATGQSMSFENEEALIRFEQTYARE